MLGVRQSGLPDIAQARDEALCIMKDNPKPKGERGEALCLLHLFERDEEGPLMEAA